MLKKRTGENDGDDKFAEGSSPAMTTCSSVMAALIAQQEDPRTVCAMVASACTARGAMVVALEDVSAMGSGEVMGDLLWGKTC